MAVFIPEIIFNRILDITPQYLREQGIKGLILDVDNTLSTHHSQTPLEGLDLWLTQMRDSGIKLIIASNARRERVEPFARRLGLDFVSLSCKPLPHGIIRAKRRMGLRRSETAMVGDQIFTDMLGANMAGVHAVLLTPILPETKKNFVIRRKLERIFINKFNRRNAK